MDMSLKFNDFCQRGQVANFDTREYNGPLVDITQWNNPIKVMTIAFNDHRLIKEAELASPDVIANRSESPAYLTSFYADGKMYGNFGEAYDAYMAKYTQTVTYKSNLADKESRYIENGRTMQALQWSELDYNILKNKGSDIDYDTVATYYLNMAYQDKYVYIKDGQGNIYGAEKGNAFISGTASSIDEVKKKYEYITKSKEYQDMMAEGGPQSLEDIATMQAACNFHAWENAYKNYDVYDDAAFAFAYAMQEKTGVYLTTRGMNPHMDFENSGKSCCMDNEVFQVMAKHQAHMNLWEDVVGGKYKNFDEITEAVQDSGDQTLIADWTEVMGFTLREDEDFSYTEVNPSHYAFLAGTSTNREDDSTLAKAWWNEFRYNIGATTDLHGSTTVTITEEDWVNILNKADEIENVHNYKNVMGKKSSEKNVDKMDEAADILERIRILQKQMKKAEKGTVSVGMKCTQVKQYQQQINALQEQLLEVRQKERIKQQVNVYV